LEIELSGSPAPNGTGTASITETGAAQDRHMAVGTLGLLARQLGPEFYGVFAVAASIVLWVQGNTTRMVGTTIVKFVAEAADWQGAPQHWRRPNWWSAWAPPCSF
jgi:hypothetical protein